MIHGFIRGQELTLSSPLIADGTIDYLSAQFTFQTKDWHGLKIYVHFIQGETHFFAEVINGRVERDKHINLAQGKWQVYLHGNEIVDGEVLMRITTEPKILNVVASGADGGDTFPEVSGDTGELILAKAEYAVELAEAIRKDLDDGKYDYTLTDKDIEYIVAKVIESGAITTEKEVLEITNTIYSGTLRSDFITVFTNAMSKLSITGLWNVKEYPMPEYVFIFTSGNTPTIFSVQSSWRWANNQPPEIKANTKYIMRIFDDIISYTEVSI